MKKSEPEQIDVSVTGLAPRLCLATCNLFLKTPLRRFAPRSRAQGGRFENLENYIADRVSNVERYEELFSKHVTFDGKTILELGCSTGYLLNAFRNKHNFTAIGADISSECIENARKKYGQTVRFVQSTAISIPVRSDSVDLVYSIDTVEHLSRPREMFMDVYRILKPGGIFLVHFGPWYNPSGSHLEDIMPFPWPHVFFSMDTLLKVAAHLYETPEYNPACYWYDEKGHRRPNPYVDRERWREFLNDLTIRKFKALLTTLPFGLTDLQYIGFGGKGYPLARLLRGLSKVPILNEFFINFVFCVLKKAEE